GGRQPAAGREGRDPLAAAERAAKVLRHAGDDVEDRRDGDQLSGGYRRRADPQQHGDARAHPASVPQLEKVADGLEIVRRGQPANPRPDPQREHDRAESRRADPPPGGQAVSVAETGRAAGRSPADDGGEHRPEDAAGAGRPAGDEEVPRARAPPADPQPETDQQRRVAEQEAEVQRHRARYCGRSRAAGTPAVLVASRIARTIASATTSAAIAPMAATSAAPRQPPGASRNTLSPSAPGWAGADARG